MRFAHFALISILASTAGFNAGCDRTNAQGGDGHDHPHGDEPEPVTVTQFGKRALLFMEYPQLVRGKSARFLAHFSVLADGEAVRSGQVSIEASGPQSIRIAVDAPKRDGLFTPEGAFPVAGKYNARLTLRSPQVEEVFELGEVVVHPDEKSAHAAAAAAASEDLPGAVPFLMEQQWKIKLLLAEASKRTLVSRIRAPAQIEVPQGASAVVSPPTAGRLLPPDGGALPRAGDRVQAGQVLGYVEPPLGPSELAQLQALRLEFNLKSLEVERGINQATTRVRFAERERERVTKLREQGLSTQQQLDQAEQNYLVAKTEGEAAEATKRSLEELRKGGGDGGGGANVAIRLPLQSPVSGVIVKASRAAGEHVKDADELFRVVNAEKVWVEAQVSEFDLPELPESPAALLVVGNGTGKSLDILSAPGGKLLHVGQVVDPSSRTVTLRYEMQNPGGNIKPGMTASVQIATAEAREAVAVPQEAIVMEQGMPTAYVMVEGETFQKRELELGARDGGFVEVRSGIKPGEHVATRGAYVIRLAASSPASFGHGHVH